MGLIASKKWYSKPTVTQHHWKLVYADYPCLGWREWVALPDLDIRRIKVKIDTGARTSALHVGHMEFFHKKHSGHKRFVRFHVLPKQRSHQNEVIAEAEVLEDRLVRSSTGVVTHRPVIVTRLQIDGETWPIEITLVNRDMMGFRMLVGRQAISHRFVVDPGRSFLVGKI